MRIKNLERIFENAKNDDIYYNKDDFLKDCKQFAREFDKKNIVLAMKVSRSGMTRHFTGLLPWQNTVMNIIYNNKISNKPVKVGGCGMNMHRHLLYSVIQEIRKNETDNANASHQPLLTLF